jgi:3-methyladenine DNA glycosylase AlkD
MDVDALAGEIDGDLRSRGTPERARQEKAYLKSALEHYGVTMPAIRAVAKDARRRHPELTHDELVALVRELWAQPVHERRMAAVELLGLFPERLGPDDVAMLEQFLRESRTWALVDAIAPSIVGPLVEQHPEVGEVLDRWATDDDFWIRRAALLALLLPLRRGAGDFERFSRYADSMLDEKEFFIQKAIGWVLRDTGKKRPDLVYQWVLPRAARLSSVTRREVLKPLNEEQRASVLAAQTAAPR